MSLLTGQSEQDSVAAVYNALEHLRQGKFVLVVDEDDPYGHADLTMAAELVTPEAINFMATHGGSIIYVCLSEERCRELGLPPMRLGGDPGRWESAIAVSIEAREGVTTGISAADRAQTVRVAANPSKDHSDLVSPGHVFPVCARSGGVLERAGRTEASVDLAFLAGLFAAGVDCELVIETGEAAQSADLMKFAAEYGIRLITVADVVAFRLNSEAER